MKRNLLYIIGLLLLVGCKKEKSYDYYYQEADKKLKEIESLIKTFSCDDISLWKVDVVSGGPYSTIYFPIAPVPNSQYLVLKKEYEDLIQKAKKLDKRISYFDYYWIPPINIECIDGSPKVMTANDYDLEEATKHLNNMVTEMKNLADQVNCESINNWQLYTLIKDCEINYIVINKNDENIAREVSRLYEIVISLQSRIAFLDETKRNCFTTNHIKSFEVTCEGNNPIVEVVEN